MNQEAAQKLAIEYYQSGKGTPDHMTFAVQNTDDVIIVVVTRSPARYEERAIKSIQEATRSFTPSAAGKPCPTCGGSGKV